MMTKKEAKKLTDAKTKCDFIRGVNDALEGIYDKFYRGTFQKIHSQEETGLPNVPAELDKLIDSL